MSEMKNRRCMGCMSIKESLGACPICGFDETKPNDPNYIPPGTPLDHRYLVGQLKHYNGEGATYIGFDRQEEKPVWIREYFPFTIAHRDEESGEIQSNTGRGAQYKALLSDFVELCNEVRRLSISDPVVPVENMLGENNTIYVIYKYLETQTLEDYLISQGGSLSVEEALDLLIPLFNAVDNIHLRGIIHRGLSPYTVVIDEQGELYIDGFALGAARTGASELQAELFNGYSAPEQYTSTGWQGTWTDVYALATIFYRTVSGIVPPKATRVSGKHPLTPLGELVSGVPENVSFAVKQAMEPNAQSRTQTVGAFLSDLMAEEGVVSTAVFDPGRLSTIPIETISVEASTEGHTENISSPKELENFRAEFRRSQRPASPPEESMDFDFREEEGPRQGRFFLIILIAAVMVLGGILAVVVNQKINPRPKEEAEKGGLVSQEEVEPSTEDSLEDPEETPVSQQEEIEGEIPNFIGRKRSVVEFHPNYRDVYEFTFKEEFSSEEEGIIIQQSPKEGTKVSGKTEVTLTVSKGGEKIEMPDVVGKEYEEALQEITRAAQTLQVSSEELQISRVERFREGAKEGEVIETIPRSGEEFDPKKDRIQLIVGAEIPVSQSEEASQEESSTQSSRGSSQTSSSSSSSSQSTTWQRGDEDEVDRPTRLPTEE